MDNSIGGAVFTPLFHQTHLTDEEIAYLASMTLKTVRHYRWEGSLSQGERVFVEREAYSGRRVCIKKTFTHVDDVRAWFTASGRTGALVALDKLIADKLAASPEVGE